VYANPGRYEIVVGVQDSDADAGFIPGADNARLTAQAFVNQTFAAQTGYTKAPAYNYATRVAISDYWLPLESYACCVNAGSPQETVDAYNYFYGSSSQRTAAMNNYGSTAATFLGLLNYWQTVWAPWVSKCAERTRPSSCALKGLTAYEGGNTTGGGLAGTVSADDTSSVTGANNSNPCALNIGRIGTARSATINDGILKITGVSGNTPFGNGVTIIGPGINATVNGYYGTNNNQYTLAGSPANAGPVAVTVYGLFAVAGMPIALSNVSETGGTSWATLAAGGNLAVGPNPTAQSITLYQNGNPANCSSYDTLNSATLTYVGSHNWINVLRTRFYWWPGINQAIPGISGTPLTGTDYANFVANGGVNPAQSNFANYNWPWSLAFFDVYQFATEGSCTACTVSGTTLTLGGTVTGIFNPGDVIWGKCITNPSPTTRPTCTANNPAGMYPQTTIASNSAIGRKAGDTVTLSQNQNAATSAPFAAIALIPVPQTGLQAIEAWNNTLPFLLKRDLDPAANDGTPMYLNKAA
jgi:hypothetical protein